MFLVPPPSFFSNLQAIEPPPIRREFRGVWVATVDNIDWPSKKNLSSKAQRAELLRILDLAAGMHLNAIILQVRPSADALYPSNYEPWSEFLTGRQGRAPNPRYDPLEFAVREAHRRGLELHCWFNPYRAKHPAQKGPVSQTHIIKTHPAAVVRYGSYMWMDPGQTYVQKHTLDVIDDVVRRYDIDGVHIDDYFYPYPEGTKEFPDAKTYAAYRHRGGYLSKPDWRRQNVDRFIKTLYESIKHEKPWVKFGISPFGIYRPGVPTGIHSGVDQYAELYADAKKWLNEGWCDYFSPQLYWPIQQKAQSFPVLLNWWASQNLKHRNLWPGLYTSRTGPSDGRKNPQEFLDEIELTRRTPGATGNIHFSMIALLNDYNGVTDLIRGREYADPALPPASPWLEDKQLPQPELQHDGASFRWRLPEGQALWWVIWRRYNQRWIPQVLSGETLKLEPEPELPTGRLNAFCVAAVDKCGVMSPLRVLSLP